MRILHNKNPNIEKSRINDKLLKVKMAKKEEKIKNSKLFF
jgi:hypothetical protein